MVSGTLLNPNDRQRYSLPASYDSWIQVVAGGLMTYGASYTETGQRSALLPILAPMRKQR